MMTSWTEVAATALALAYVLLAIREQRLCFIAAIASACIYCWLFWQARLYMEALLQVFYVAVSGYGFYHWQSSDHMPLTVSRWSRRQHVLALIGISGTTVVLGWWLQRYTDAALPWADSFTTSAALVTSWMVALKILENWLYWIVIDLASVIIFIDRELWLTASLFGLYALLSVAGYRQWRRHLQQH